MNKASDDIFWTIEQIKVMAEVDYHKTMYRLSTAFNEPIDKLRKERPFAFYHVKEYAFLKGLKKVRRINNNYVSYIYVPRDKFEGFDKTKL